MKHEYVHEARVDSMLLIDAVKVDSSKTVLEVGVGMGVGAVFLSGIAKSFTGTDLNPHALEVTRRNVMLNGDDRGVELIQGDCFEPVKGRKFDVILTNPPQLPTPVDRERSDWTGKSNNAGHDGREILNRIIGSAANYLNAGGKLYILHLSLSDIEETRYQLGKRGFQTDIITERVKSFGSLSFERKDHIRSINSAASFHEDSYQLIVLECQLIG